jgi:hypothetical protein
MDVIVGDLAGKILSYHTNIQVNIAVKSVIKVVQVGDKNHTCKGKKISKILCKKACQPPPITHPNRRIFDHKNGQKFNVNTNKTWL